VLGCIFLAVSASTFNALFLGKHSLQISKKWQKPLFAYRSIILETSRMENNSLCAPFLMVVSIQRCNAY
jgi:hypothetical protein